MKKTIKCNEIEDEECEKEKQEEELVDKEDAVNCLSFFLSSSSSFLSPDNAFTL